MTNRANRSTIQRVVKAQVSEPAIVPSDTGRPDQTAAETARPGSRTYRLIGPDGAPYEGANKGPLGGHRRSRIYGRLDGPAALRAIARGGPYPKFRVFFADEATAVAAGYRPCGVCMRERYREWKRISTGQSH